MYQPDEVAVANQISALIHPYKTLSPCAHERCTETSFLGVPALYQGAKMIMESYQLGERS